MNTVEPVEMPAVGGIMHISIGGISIQEYVLPCYTVRGGCCLAGEFRYSIGVADDLLKVAVHLNLSIVLGWVCWRGPGAY
jgi:hypothetical protein